RSHYSRLMTSIVPNNDDNNYYSRLTTSIVPEVRTFNINRQMTSDITNSDTKHYQEKWKRQLEE
ncbi:2323_t:CDS:1, partial [Funneliformis mosseae]